MKQWHIGISIIAVSWTVLVFCRTNITESMEGVSPDDARQLDDTKRDLASASHDLAATPSAGRARAEEISSTVNPHVVKNGVSGWVLDESGIPLAGATVSCVIGPKVESVTTNADGGFAIAALPSQDGLVLEVKKPQYVTEYAKTYRGRALTLRLIGGVQITGRVLVAESDGSLTPKQSYLLRQAPYREFSEAVDVDSEGRFAFAARTDHKYNLWVELDTGPPWLEVLSVGQVSQEHDIILLGGVAKLSVRVVDDWDGNPLVGANVAIRGSSKVLTLAHGVTNADGLWSGEIWRGIAASLSASAANYAVRDRFLSPERIATASTSALDIHLVPEAVVFGVVRSPSGELLEQAEVTVEAVSKRGVRPQHSGVRSVEQVPREVTGPQGDFRIEGLGSSRTNWDVRVTVQHQSSGVVEVQPVSLTAGRETGPIEVVLVSGGTVSGRVTNNGLPVRANVSLLEHSSIRSNTSDAGDYELERVPVGAWTLSTKLELHPHIEVQTPVVIIEDADTVQDIDCRFAIERVEGFVVGGDGEPIKNVRVRLGSQPIKPSGPVYYSDRTNAEGYFAIELPQLMTMDQKLDYKISLSRWSKDYAEEGVCPPQTINIMTEPSVSVWFDAKARYSGVNVRPRLSWHPGALGANEMKAWWMSDFIRREDGYIEYSVPSGDGWIEINPEGYAPQRLSIPDGGGFLGLIEFDKAGNGER